MKEHEENLKKIYNKFEKNNQYGKLYEEITELAIAFDSDSTDDIVDEISDVLIVAYQLYLNNKKIRDRVKFKIDRTLKRIESGYYTEVKNEN